MLWSMQSHDVVDDHALAADAAAFRRFNRSYTRFIGTLNEGLLQTEFSLAEGRVLYELATQAAPQAKEIAAALDIDAGYLSRILAKFQRAGLVERRISKEDNRAADLRLTVRGRAAFRTLNTRSEKQARSILKDLPPRARTQFVDALRTIESIALKNEPTDSPVILRTHRPGDMGVIVQREGAGYVEQFGWDETFEALVAKIAAEFITNFDPARERCWIAEIDGRHAGHIFCVRHPEQPDTAKLRLLFVDLEARGRGVGQMLVSECIGFAHQAGYSKITLWTQSILVAAHRIYQRAGFRLVREEPHHSFGKDLVGQTWEMDL
jgi:DNA-binding MarR family transcriptional regulator/GNAT superfamily N-acetyltransferase